MRMIWNKGHRIRASDKHLVYHFSIETLLFVFVTVLLLLNSKQLMRTDWEHFSLLEKGAGGNGKNNWRRNNVVLVRPADRCCRI